LTVVSGMPKITNPRILDRGINTGGERKGLHECAPVAIHETPPKVGEVLPILYLRGLSTGDIRKAFGALLGDEAAGLSRANRARFTQASIRSRHSDDRRRRPSLRSLDVKPTSVYGGTRRDGD